MVGVEVATYPFDANALEERFLDLLGDLRSLVRQDVGDPDSSPMKRRDSKGSHRGYYTHYVVDAGKSRIILNALVTPSEVTKNQPMLDLLWRTSFRWKIAPRQVTGDTAYATVENIADVEQAGTRA